MGEDAIQVCPQGASGFARWTCGLDGLWSSERPNLGECQSLWLSRLEQRLQGASGLNEVASDLSTSTSTKTLYGGDLNVVAKILQALGMISHKKSLMTIFDHKHKIKNFIKFS